jgi:hypothetical protein
MISKDMGHRKCSDTVVFEDAFLSLATVLTIAQLSLQVPSSASLSGSRARHPWGQEKVMFTDELGFIVRRSRPNPHRIWVAKQRKKGRDMMLTFLVGSRMRPSRWALFTYEKNKSRRLLLKIWDNRRVQFDKSDCPILSGPTTVRGTTRLWWGAPHLSKWHLDSGDAWTMTTLEVEAVAKRSNWQKKGN